MNAKRIADFIITEGDGTYTERNRVNLIKNIQLHIEDGTIIVLEDSSIKAVLTYHPIEYPKKIYVCDATVKKDQRRASAVSELLRELADKCPEAEKVVYEWERNDENDISVLDLNRFKKGETQMKEINNG